MNGAILGWRDWVCVGSWELTLQSRFANYFWRPGLNEAECRRLTSDGRPMPHLGRHDPPTMECHCGLYARPAIPPPVMLPPSIGHPAGLVAGWGMVCYHDEGWRAQFATILGLLDDGRCAIAKRLAQAYDVPLLRERDLVELGLELGCHWPILPEPPGRPVLDWSGPKLSRVYLPNG